MDGEPNTFDGELPFSPVKSTVSFDFGDSNGRGSSSIVFSNRRRFFSLPRASWVEVAPLEIAPLEVDLLEIGPLEVDLLEVAPLVVDPLEVAPLEVDLLEVGPLEVDPLEVAPPEVDLLEVGPSDVVRRPPFSCAFQWRVASCCSFHS